MEQNLPIISKKIWKIVRVLYFMLRKGISKGKLFSDITTMMKRGKLAGKAAIHNLMFHGGFSGEHGHTPAFHLPFKRKHSSHAPPPRFDGDTMAAALEIFHSASASPVLPGFGPSPMVRQLRVTDSPFPLRDYEEDNHVDEAAEEFIMKFYKDLKRQNSTPFHARAGPGRDLKLSGTEGV